MKQITQYSQPCTVDFKAWFCEPEEKDIPENLALRMAIEDMLLFCRLYVLKYNIIMQFRDESVGSVKYQA